MAGQAIQFPGAPKHFAHLKSQTRQTPSLGKVPSAHYLTHFWSVPVICKNPSPGSQLVHELGWLTQVLHGALHATHWKVSLLATVPAGQTV